MREGSFTIFNELGFHARAAAQFVKLANNYDCEITVYKDGYSANGKSILGLLTLAASKGTVLRIIASGKHEEEAINTLGQIINNKFGEQK